MNKEIQRQISLVKEDIQKRFPNCPYTIRILLWDDNTSLVECRYGIGEKLYISQYYNNYLVYKEVDVKFKNGIMIGADGTEYYPQN